MRLYIALDIPRTPIDRLIYESYQAILRKTAGSADVHIVNESYLILADEKKRYLYDLFGDSVIDIIRDSQASFLLLGALSPANIILLAVAYGMAVISLILLSLLIVTRPYYNALQDFWGSYGRCILLLSIFASNTHIYWSKRRMCEDKTSLCMRLSIACLMAAVELFFMLAHFDIDMKVFRCLLLVPFFVCEALNLRTEDTKELRKHYLLFIFRF